MGYANSLGGDQAKTSAAPPSSPRQRMPSDESFSESLRRSDDHYHGMRTPSAGWSASSSPSNFVTPELNRLNAVEAANPTEAKIKAYRPSLMDNISLGLAWFKISVNTLFSREIFTLRPLEYSNPLTVSSLNSATCYGVAKVIDLSLDYLKQLKTDDRTARLNAQAKLIQEICHGPAGDFILDVIGFTLQESRESGNGPPFLGMLPPAQKQQLQQLLAGLEDSGLMVRAQKFSRYLTINQQKTALQKLNQFPLCQLGIMPNLVTNGLKYLETQYPNLNNLLTQVINGDPHAKAKSLGGHPYLPQALRSSDLPPETIVNNFKNTLESLTGLIDTYKRTSHLNSERAQAGRKPVIQALTQTLLATPDYVQSLHQVFEAIQHANLLLNSAKPHSESHPLAESQLFKLAHTLVPQIPDDIILNNLETVCKHFAAPLTIVKSITDRLSLRQEQIALLTLFDEESDFLKGVMSLSLNSLKSMAKGELVEESYHEPKPLSSELDLKGGFELIAAILAKDLTPGGLREVVLEKQHLSFIRNLLSQSDTENTIAQLNDKLPIAFQESFTSMLENYSVNCLAKLGHNLMPHLTDLELEGLVQRLPESLLELASDKLKSVLQYLGDPDNNLTTVLDRQQRSDRAKLDVIWNDCETEIQNALSDNPEDFICFLDQVGVERDRKGKIPEHKKITFEYQQQQARRAFQAAGSKPTSNALDELSRLLADIGIKQILSGDEDLIQNPKKPAEFVNNLTVLRSAISRYRASEDIHHIISLLMPAANDSDIPDPQTIDLNLRKQLLGEFFGALARGIDASSSMNTRKPLEKESVDILWAVTKDLISCTERKVVVELNDDQQLIFMEDGTCVDGGGCLLPKGHQDNQRLRAKYNIDAELENQRVGVRQGLKDMFQKHFPALLKLVADNPLKADFNAVLEAAHLPEDVKLLMVNSIDQILPQDLRESVIGQYATQGMVGLPPAIIVDVITRIPDTLLDLLAGQVTRLINDLNPYEQMPFFKKFADQLVASLGENQSVQSVADTLTKAYYTQICHADKRVLANSILAIGCPVITSNGDITPQSMKDQVNAMTQAGGPQFQKAMQLFKGDIHIPEMREALTNMDSDIRPMLEDEYLPVITAGLAKIKVGEHVKYELVDPDDYIAKPEWIAAAPDLEPSTLKASQLKLLGSATIAQTHKAYLWECLDGVPQKDLPPLITAMKVQRARIAHAIRREGFALQRIPGNTDSSEQTLKELERSIVGETDFSREYQFGKVMQELYVQRSLTGAVRNTQVNVVDMLAHTDRILIQRFSPGTSIENLWQKKSAEFGLYFGPWNPAVEKQFQGNPNRIEVVTLNGANGTQLVTGLKIIQHDIETLHPLSFNDPLVSQLQAARSKAKIPSYQEAQALNKSIIEAVFKESGNPLKGAVSLSQQADFLKVAGDRLATLVGHFASAAFVGVRKEEAFQLSFAEPGALTEQQRQRKILVKHVVIGDKSSFLVRHFDTQGQLAKTARLTKGSNLDTDKLCEQLESIVAAPKPNFTSLSTYDTGLLNNRIRALLNESFLFTGESYIDSDRHDGNLLFQEDLTAIENSKLMCIDTGAGTIVTQYERDGMLQLATGLTSINAGLVMSGLSKLIKDFDEILDGTSPHQNASATEGLSKRAALQRDLEKSLQGGYIEEEKCQEILQFLLINSLLDPKISQHFFKDLLANNPPGLKKELLDFNHPATSVRKIMEYVNRKRLAADLDAIEIDGATQTEFEQYLSKLDYGRVFRNSAPDSLNPLEITTDGHNSLLFIKTIRKIGNVLEQHNIYAPESIIQVNRGTKFIEDQIKTINRYKLDVWKKINEQGAESGVIDGQVLDKLKPVNLGAAYISGIPAQQMVLDVWNAMSTREIGSSMWSGFNAATAHVLELLR